MIIHLCSFDPLIFFFLFGERGDCFSAFFNALSDLSISTTQHGKRRGNRWANLKFLMIFFQRLFHLLAEGAISVIPVKCPKNIPVKYFSENSNHVSRPAGMWYKILKGINSGLSPAKGRLRISYHNILSAYSFTF